MALAHPSHHWFVGSALLEDTVDGLIRGERISIPQLFKFLLLWRARNRAATKLFCPLDRLRATDRGGGQ